MFGIKRKKAVQQDNQIPYEVYETLRQPAERRRMFIIRLIAALAVVTLLIFGALALSRQILKSDDKPASTEQDASDGNGNEPTPTPAPQDQPTETEATPQPESNDPSRNMTTVPKPE